MSINHQSILTLPNSFVRNFLVVCVAGTLAACGSGGDDPAQFAEASSAASTAESAGQEIHWTEEEAAQKLAEAEERAPVVPDTLLTIDEIAGEVVAEQPVAEDGQVEKATATKLYAAGFGSPMTLPSTSARGNTNQYLKGGDTSPFTTPINLWNTPSSYRAWILGIVGASTPMAANQYSEAKFKSVVGRKGAQTQVLSLNQKAKSPSTGVQQLVLQNAYMGAEPVMYQRMWVKFDTNTLARAKSHGSRYFWQMFWEMKADPDYRIRLQLQYDNSAGLYWQVQGDPLYNANPLWSRTLKTVPVKLASHSSSAGWHKVEIYMNRPGGKFKAAIDGKVLVDYSGKLMGASGKRTNQLKFAMVYGQATLGELLVDDLEIWSAPPADAWKL